MTNDDQRRIAVAAHELGHALVARENGWPVVLVSLVGEGLAGQCCVGKRSDLSPEEAAASRVVDLQAGDIAGRMVTLGEVPVATTDPVAAREATLASLPPHEADLVDYALSAPYEPGQTDEAHAERFARVAAGDDWETCLRSGRARAWPLVLKFAPLIEALVPVLLTRLMLTGADLEAAIAATTGKERPMTESDADRRANQEREAFLKEHRIGKYADVNGQDREHADVKDPEQWLPRKQERTN